MIYRLPYGIEQDIYYGPQDGPGYVAWTHRNVWFMSDEDKQKLVSEFNPKWQLLASTAIREFWLIESLFADLELTHFYTHVGLLFAVKHISKLADEFSHGIKATQMSYPSNNNHSATDFGSPISQHLWELNKQMRNIPIMNNCPELPKHIRLPSTLIDRKQPDYRDRIGFK